MQWRAVSRYVSCRKTGWNTIVRLFRVVSSVYLFRVGCRISKHSCLTGYVATSRLRNFFRTCCRGLGDPFGLRLDLCTTVFDDVFHRQVINDPMVHGTTRFPSSFYIEILSFWHLWRSRQVVVHSRNEWILFIPKLRLGIDKLRDGSVTAHDSISVSREDFEVVENAWFRLDHQTVEQSQSKTRRLSFN